LAWVALVERYAPLIWSIRRRFRLEAADAEDVGQAVWLKLVTHLDDLRYSAALPGWATTTRRESGRVINAADARRAGERVLIADSIPDTETDTVEQELLVAEQHAVQRVRSRHPAPATAL
jgi:RNA polymerase sigma factor (sigma-70 family)